MRGQAAVGPRAEVEHVPAQGLRRGRGEGVGRADDHRAVERRGAVDAVDGQRRARGRRREVEQRGLRLERYGCGRAQAAGVGSREVEFERRRIAVVGGVERAARHPCEVLHVVVVAVVRVGGAVVDDERPAELRGRLVAVLGVRGVA